MDCHKVLVETFEKELVMLTNHMMLLKGSSNLNPTATDISDYLNTWIFNHSKSKLVHYRHLLMKYLLVLLILDCIGKQSCMVTVTPENFGGDPCPGIAKKFSVEALCS
ncbi:galactose-binding lectin domain protein [Medicago truncatula]|uniref:Galactose-binding lectin domain protein n=1 Tax=Medicago truncatula TaxID=3880 RepID=A0A072UT56_MEDTR|nr:galactose-binding lectin domain protein [Medicago truncatula]